ncbi:MAG: DNA-protecting protein DprA [Saccharospirillum sp.]|nr:DNA-protecting protein DprA [Saccharospirillum sp.]
MNLFDEHFYKPVSPLVEGAAYEALYDQQGQSFKTLAELFAKTPNSLPSDLVEPKILEKYYEQLTSIFANSDFGRFGIRVFRTAEYPTRLRDAKYPIELVYYQGNWDLAHTRSVAIVGSRKPSKEGLTRTKKLTKLLVEQGFTIVSGLASGVDQMAHLSAIEFGGATIGVLGTPLSESYPRENAELQKYIGRNHLLVSQVPFIRYGKEPFSNKRFYFPERNKLMSALTEATIIVEAGNTSGTLVQARAALEQGRKLYILESNFSNPNLTWPEKFLKKGAIKLKDINDVKL